MKQVGKAQITTVNLKILRRWSFEGSPFCKSKSFRGGNLTVIKISSVTNQLYSYFDSVEAVSRQAIPIPRRTKKDEKGEKKSIVKIPQKIHVRSNLPYPHAKKVFQGPGSDESEMEVIGHVTKKRRRSESKKKRKRNLTEGKTADQ